MLCQLHPEGHRNLLRLVGVRIDSVPNALSALALISDGAAADPYLQSIHHAVLRLMVQRMEANYGEFDQTSRAALHA